MFGPVCIVLGIINHSTASNFFDSLHCDFWKEVSDSAMTSSLAEITIISGATKYSLVIDQPTTSLWGPISPSISIKLELLSEQSLYHLSFSELRAEDF